jgi:hypothetical protein
MRGVRLCKTNFSIYQTISNRMMRKSSQQMRHLEDLRTCTSNVQSSSDPAMPANAFPGSAPTYSTHAYHCRSSWNREHSDQPPSDPKLDQEGQEQGWLGAANLA